MADSNSLEQTGNRPLACILTSVLMPEEQVSERTQTTYDIGAQLMLEHLMGGDWDVTVVKHNSAHFQEFVSRVIANAQRQGIDVAQTPVPEG